MRARLRFLFAVVAGGLVGVLVLTGCQTHVGDAARVGDQSIGESQVMQYITPRGTPFIDTNGQPVEPKPLVVSLLVEQALAEHVLAATPQGVPSQGELQQAETQVLQQADQTVDGLRGEYTKRGFTTAAADLALRANTLIQLAIGRVAKLSDADTPSQQFLTFLQKQHIPIYVDPRYGTWDLSTLSVTSATDQLPFLRLQGSYAPAAASQ